MYADPTHLRDNPIKVRFNDPDYALIVALANFNGRQPAAFVRELALAAVASMEKGRPEADAA
ncbi:hypothetical protein ACQR5V_21540 [Xanthomonas oryzae pv. oryzicola]|uniref:Uncharacterized protein n=2 Tax=Xanthomonas TaxID=338 RepID=A0A7Z7J0U9_XANCH|nr:MULTISPECIES: hypothetical protein [Xanthomonas]AJQ88074.1 hypothetical protein BE73_14225 [Xanthomonas oryzae pv. oryzicola]ASL01787.1 hypothetical protein XcvCFBP7113P_16830 [Xanthomonas citri pv. vignicola]ATS39278.1 hypothetical protein XcfCFBP6988P_15050 [Xanthomonas citri pv. phaseoli var. fuscans]ATS41915.1 hypothetical protein XcfCFBP6989P_05440 [Xanthomonas citri pv. phaseoli var. fuscans]ATS47281.1 hypothetical protein XcfCFBP6990P_11920 [Xanthomonas citri pv. phaseoli var. fuscan